MEQLLIPSQSDPTTVYRVERIGGAWQCGCKSFQYRKSCGHIRLASGIMGAKPMILDAGHALLNVSKRLSALSDELKTRQLDIGKASQLWERVSELEERLNSLSGWLNR